MAEVATRTSKGGVLDGVEKNASGDFDVRSWKGLTEILKAARASKMDEGEYAAFRDTVLQYAQSGGSDAALRKNIEETAAKFKVALPVREERSQAPVEPKSVEAVPVAKVDIARPFTGTVRPSPRFDAPQASTNAAPAVASTEKKASVPDNLPVAKASAKDVPEFMRPTPAAAAEPVHIKKIIPTSSENTEPVSTPKISEVPQSPRLPVREERPQTGPSAGMKTVEEYKARIMEIKRTVNAQVGNPVTLMDGGNAIGREYMQALLGAMKAVSGAAPGTLQSSMEQLEKVFARVSALPAKTANETPKQPSPEVKPPKKVEETQNMGSQSEVQPRIDVRHTPTTTPDRRLSSAPIAGMSTPQAPRPMDSAPAQKPTSVSIPKPHVPQTPKPPTAERQSATPQQPIQTPKPQVASHAIPSLADALKNAGREKASERVEPVSEKVVQTPVPTPQTPEQTSRPQSSAPNVPTAAPAKALPNVLKIGETSPVVKAMGKHAAKGVGRSGFDATVEGDTDHPVPPGVKEDPHSPEVDEGLKQLLHEWSIFRGGGLFGTGPSGVEHPLWEKLAPLPMSIVAAGTWEGATKEAILSIRDYINGWRHEQGVSYIQTESFENYLRRVVKRIIKRISG